MAQQLSRRDSNRFIEALMGGQRLIATFNRKRTPFRGNDRRIGQDLSQPFVVERGGHDQQLEILTQPLLHVEQQRQRQIGLQAALMKFIKDHQPHTVQLGIVLQHPGQDPFRHHFQPRRRTDAGFRAHTITHGFAGLFTEQFGQALRHIARRQPARFQQNDFPGNIALFEDL
ncbi:hypothetical protein D3C72_1661900 [compost metagenome]